MNTTTQIQKEEKKKIVIKVCGCGRVHRNIPGNARVMDDNSPMDGWYWECICHSTLFVPKEIIE